MYRMMGMVNNCSVHSGMITSHGIVSRSGVTTFYTGVGGIDGGARVASARAEPLLRADMVRLLPSFAC